MIAVEPAPRATGVDERDVPSAAIEILPKDGWFVRHVAGFGCAGRAPDIFLRRPHMDDHAAAVAVLQTLQRHLAKVHARKVCRHRNSKEFFEPRHVDRSGALGEARCLDLHESSAALPR